MKKPSIVFIMADQLAAGFLSCYGFPAETTPALDRLALNGARFERCYTTSPVCAPNRASMLTGRSPVVHGVVSNNYLLKADNPTYVHALKRAGYRTGGFGKFHHTPMAQPLPRDLHYLGFDETVLTEDPKWGAWLDWVAVENPEHFEEALAVCWGHPWSKAYGLHRTDMRPAHSAAQDRHLAPRREASTFELMYSSPLPPELHQTTFITDRSLDFMGRHIEHEADQPFFCFVSYVDPHDPYDPPAPYDTMFPASDMPPPTPPSWCERGNPVLDASRQFLNFHKICDNDEAIRQMRALYCGSLRFIDDQVARIVRFLDEKGIADDTIIVFTTDHGDMMGDQGLLTKGVKHYDNGVRVPLIVQGPATAAGITTDHLTSTLDFFPTLCDWAGLPPEDRPPLEGCSFEAAARGSEEEGPTRGEVLIEFAQTTSVVTDDRWRLTLFAGADEDVGEMFNLENDPEEQSNLYYDPDWQDMRELLMKRLIRAEARRNAVPQYRVMPITPGRRWYLGGPGNGQLVSPLPAYPEVAPPNLSSE